MRLAIVDQISDPGEPGKPNDDALAHGDTFAAAFDGATGIADRALVPGADSDAAWIARLAADVFCEHAPRDLSTAEIVRAASSSARFHIEALHSLADLPRYSWPTSSFVMGRLVDENLELSGLGDCVAYVRSPDGKILRHCALPANRGNEQAFAKALLEQAGGYRGGWGIPREGPVLDRMRKARSTQNLPGGIWTLGLEPDASEQVAVRTLAAAPKTTILVMSDGFAALAEDYLDIEPREMLARAGRGGLAELLDRLRHLERELDPDALRWPRFKRSDDATAILAEITE